LQTDTDIIIKGDKAMIKKRIISIIVILTLVFALTACGGRGGSDDADTGAAQESPAASEKPADASDGPGGTDDPTAAPQEPAFDFTPTSKTIKVSWFVPWWEKADLHQYVFDEFARKFPEYELDHSVYSGDIQQLAASIQAGTQADVWVGGDPNWAQYVTAVYQGLLEPLDEFLENDPDYNFGNISPNAMNSCRFVDGKYYAVPYEIAANVLIWNKDVFARAGLNPEKPPETFSEFYDYAQRIVRTDSNGVPTQLGVYGALPGWVFFSLSKRYTINEYGTVSRLNEPWVREVEEYCGKFESIYGGAEKLPAGVQFNVIEGNVGMEVGNLTQLNGYAQSGVNFGFSALPRPDDFDEHVIPAFLWMYVGIPKGSQNPKGGWMFLKYAVTDALVLKGEKEFQNNPSRWIPTYIAHQPTREKIYNLFLANVDEDVREMVAKRDQLIDSINYYMPNSPLKMRQMDIENKWWDKFQKGEVNALERYEGAHTEFTAELELWKKDMISKGWQFPEDGPPIPPAE